MADDYINDGQHTIHEELEVLESIYIDELKVDYNERHQPSCITLQLHPATGDEVDKKYVCMTLELHITELYPDEVPEIIIRNPRGLGEEELLSLHAAMINLATERQGCPMLFEIIELAKEDLTEGNIPRCPCTICYEHFHEGDKFTRTECYHYFHQACLDRYAHHFKEEKRSEESSKPKHLRSDEDSLSTVPCPVCREEIEYTAEGQPDTSTSDSEKVGYKPSAEMIRWQREMVKLREKQREKGGIINLDEERNKFLVTEDTVFYSTIAPESTPAAEESKSNNSYKGKNTEKRSGGKDGNAEEGRRENRFAHDDDYTNRYKGRYQSSRPWSGKNRGRPNSGRGRGDNRDGRRDNRDGREKQYGQYSDDRQKKNDETEKSGSEKYTNYRPESASKQSYTGRREYDDYYDRRPDSHRSREHRNHTKPQRSNTDKAPSKPDNDIVKSADRPGSAETRDKVTSPQTEEKLDGRKDGTAASNDKSPRSQKGVRSSELQQKEDQGRRGREDGSQPSQEKREDITEKDKRKLDDSHVLRDDHDGKESKHSKTNNRNQRSDRREHSHRSESERENYGHDRRYDSRNKWSARGRGRGKVKERDKDSSRDTRGDGTKNAHRPEVSDEKLPSDSEKCDDKEGSTRGKITEISDKNDGQENNREQKSDNIRGYNKGRGRGRGFDKGFKDNRNSQYQDRNKDWTGQERSQGQGAIDNQDRTGKGRQKSEMNSQDEANDKSPHNSRNTLSAIGQILTSSNSETQCKSDTKRFTSETKKPSGFTIRRPPPGFEDHVTAKDKSVMPPPGFGDVS